MGIKHIRDGADFEFPSSFGFSGSSAPGPGLDTSDRGHNPTSNKPPMDPASPHHATATHEPGGPGLHKAAHNNMGEPFAEGGHPHGHHVMHSETRADGAEVHHHAHGGMTVHHADGHVTHHHHDGSPVHAAHGGAQHHMHPHGHHVVHVEHHADGRIVHHHGHGGHSVHHKDGRITHHHEDGSPVHAAQGGHEGYHDSESEYVHRAKGGPAGDREMIREAEGLAKKVKRHEEAEMHESPEHHAMGGRHMGQPMAHEMPINRPPRNPQRSVTPRNQMPGGQMGYGVEPGSEPDMAGSGQSIPQLAKGGQHRKHRG